MRDQTTKAFGALTCIAFDIRDLARFPPMALLYAEEYATACFESFARCLPSTRFPGSIRASEAASTDKAALLLAPSATFTAPPDELHMPAASVKDTIDTEPLVALSAVAMDTAPLDTMLPPDAPPASTALSSGAAATGSAGAVSLSAGGSGAGAGADTSVRARSTASFGAVSMATGAGSGAEGGNVRVSAGTSAAADGGADSEPELSVALAPLPTATEPLPTTAFAFACEHPFVWAESDSEPELPVALAPLPTLTEPLPNTAFAFACEHPSVWAGAEFAARNATRQASRFADLQFSHVLMMPHWASALLSESSPAARAAREMR